MTPEEIAVSIVAELIAVRHEQGRNARSEKGERK
jgi:xanthine/CO dehydrogenase XdhC/CoxF family maturation factor